VTLENTIDSKLEAFRAELTIFNVGALGTVLVLTRKAKKLGLPLESARVITEGGGQVARLSGRAINVILKEHGIDRLVGTESGRTSRGTVNLARAYATFLNSLHPAQIEQVEAWWVARFVEYFNTEPFNLNYDSSKTLGSVLQNILDQALERQRKSPGKTYIGTVLQHLIGAKLDLALPNETITHHGSSVADASSSRSGDFEIDDVAIHCTTAPQLPLLQKCKMNLQSGKRPLILTMAKMIGAAEGLAEELGINGRVEIMDAVQFIASNLYELSRFKSEQRQVSVHQLMEKYNEIISKYETDESLQIRVG
jgi:hypothetical protein